MVLFSNEQHEADSEDELDGVVHDHHVDVVVGLVLDEVRTEHVCSLADQQDGSGEGGLVALGQAVHLQPHVEVQRPVLEQPDPEQQHHLQQL